MNLDCIPTIRSPRSMAAGRAGRRDPNRESVRPVDAGLIVPVIADELSWQSNKQYVVVEPEAGPPQLAGERRPERATLASSESVKLKHDMLRLIRAVSDSILQHALRHFSYSPDSLSEKLRGNCCRKFRVEFSVDSLFFEYDDGAPR